MSDIKSDFKEWLQEHFNKSTAYSYYGLVQKIFNKNFDDSRDWHKHSESIMPLLARYFEFANREYKLDRVTTWYALDYFDEILKFIYPKQNKTYNYEPTVKIFIKNSPIIYETTLYKLYDCLKYLSYILYGYNIKYDSDNIDIVKLEMLFNNALFEIEAGNRKKLAIYIKYEKNSSMEKLALSKYYMFLQQLQSTNLHSIKSSSNLNIIKSKNPNKTVDGHYKIVQQISGYNPLKIEATNETQRLDINFTLTKRDLSEIFCLNPATVSKLLEKISLPTNKTTKYDDEDYKLGMQITKATTKQDVIIEYETELRTYYNTDNINNYLEKHHHCQHYKEVDYTKEGYKHWCNRKKAIETISIGKTAFFEHIWGIRKKDREILSISYIDYTDYKTKYYMPEVRFLKKHPIFRKITYTK